MQMSVAIGPYGSYDPVETPKPLWGSPGAELSTWTTFQFCCETAIHGHALRHGPPELYSYTALYIIQLYIAIHYRTSTTPLCRRAYMCMHMLCMHMSRICQRGVVGTPPQPLRNAGRQPMAWLGSCTHSLKDGGDQVMRD